MGRSPSRERLRAWTKVRWWTSPTASNLLRVIYCVVPEELAGELLPRLESYYADDPNVEVIVDRRAHAGDRRAGAQGTPDERRQIRDRRRPRAMGTFPSIEAHDPDA